MTVPTAIPAALSHDPVCDWIRRHVRFSNPCHYVGVVGEQFAGPVDQAYTALQISSPEEPLMAPRSPSEGVVVVSKGWLSSLPDKNLIWGVKLLHALSSNYVVAAIRAPRRDLSIWEYLFDVSFRIIVAEPINPAWLGFWVKRWY